MDATLGIFGALGRRSDNAAAVTPVVVKERKIIKRERSIVSR
jgi:hypothetical protein